MQMQIVTRESAITAMEFIFLIRDFTYTNRQALLVSI